MSWNEQKICSFRPPRLFCGHQKRVGTRSRGQVSSCLIFTKHFSVLHICTNAIINPKSDPFVLQPSLTLGPSLVLRFLRMLVPWTIEALWPNVDGWFTRTKVSYPKIPIPCSAKAPLTLSFQYLLVRFLPSQSYFLASLILASRFQIPHFGFSFTKTHNAHQRPSARRHILLFAYFFSTA